MTVFNMTMIVIASVIAVCFGWGMRGDLIGGEEGAALPGALLGFCLSVFSGIPLLRDNYLVFMALGMVGMFIGGTEPYAQTLGMFYWGDGFSPKPENLKKSVAGLLVKGGAWFGIAAGIFGIGFSAMTGLYYEWVELVVLIVALVIMRFAGTRIINYPYDVEKKQFPKFYFSKTSPEEWGGLWFMLITMFTFILYHKDWFSLKLLIAGVAGGAVGWVIAQSFSAFTAARMKNGRYFFKNFQEKGRIDNWKIMEFCFGAIGALSISLGFVLQSNTVMRYAGVIEKNGGLWSPLKDIFGHNLEFVVPAAWLVLLLADMLQHVVKKPKKIRKKTLYSRYNTIKNVCHRPIICYIPMLGIVLGSVKISVVMSTAVLFWLAAEEFTFVQLCKLKINKTVSAIASYLITFTLVGVAWMMPEMFLPMTVFAGLSLVYIMLSSSADIIEIVQKNKGKNVSAVGIKTICANSGAFFSVKGFYVFCTIVILIMIYFT